VILGAQTLARRRVPLGFLTAAITLLFARPTPAMLSIGFAVALAGEAIRVWAAGHLEKSREVTRSGPYHFVRHPLYVGSGVMAAGIVIAANSLVILALAAIYMTTTIVAAVQTEEAFLHRTFGDTYERYSSSTAEPMVRHFSMARAMRNREYRAALGLLIGFALLALKMRVLL
jgi:protein-S-isoprenylcysteine O-methyltransferase Ste14